jgi:hypothetical protein
MKKILTFAVLCAATAMLSSAATEAAAQSKKELKRELAALQDRVNLTAGTINYLNPEYSPDEHAVLVLPKDISIRYAFGRTVMLAPGNHSLQFIDNDLILRGFDSVESTWLDKYDTVEAVFEAGKYYTVKYDPGAVAFILESGAIIELTDGKVLETTRNHAAAIRQQAAAIFEYMKANPRELTGTFARQMANMHYTFDGERFTQESRALGLGNYTSGRYWFDGRSMIFHTDTVGTKRENAKASEMFRNQSLYYMMDGGDWVVSAKPITNPDRKTIRFERQ